MLFPTKFTSLINTRGLIDSASLENHHNNRPNRSGNHKWPETFLERCTYLRFIWTLYLCFISTLYIYVSYRPCNCVLYQPYLHTETKWQRWLKSWTLCARQMMLFLKGNFWFIDTSINWSTAFLECLVPKKRQAINGIELATSTWDWGNTASQPPVIQHVRFMLTHGLFWIVSKTLSKWHGRSGTDRPGVGVTKPIFSVPLFSTSSVIVKTNVSYWISRLYLAGVAAAELRWHLSNMNVVHGILQVLLQDRKFCLRRN